MGQKKKKKGKIEIMDKGTMGQRDKGTKRQRDKGSKLQRDKRTKGQRDIFLKCCVASYGRVRSCYFTFSFCFAGCRLEGVARLLRATGLLHGLPLPQGGARRDGGTGETIEVNTGLGLIVKDSLRLVFKRFFWQICCFLNIVSHHTLPDNYKRFMTYPRLLLDQVDLQRLEETGWTPKTE